MISRRVDAHKHLWDWTDHARFLGWTAGQPVLQTDHLLDEVDAVWKKLGIVGCVAVQAQERPEETEWLLRLADGDARILGVTGWVDPRRNVTSQIESFRPHRKLKALRFVLQSEGRDFMLDPKFVAGVQAIGKAGLIYELLVFPEHLRAACKLAQACPDTRFIVDHIAKPWISAGALSPWDLHIHDLAKFENIVGCKVSGMVTEAQRHQRSWEVYAPYLDVVLNAFGPERIIFGSDHPVCLPWGTYEEVFGIVETFLAQRGFDSRIEEAIFGAAAVRIYDLQLPE
jgi:L-fuconolactonase